MRPHIFILTVFFSPIFQSTHPLRDATVMASHKFSIDFISIHAPLTGCDLKGSANKLGGSLISIHAPLTGCDFLFLNSLIQFFLFQSTHPLRDATNKSVLYGCSQKKISIHAPLTGCDS